MNEQKPWRKALQKGFEIPELTRAERNELHALLGTSEPAAVTAPQDPPLLSLGLANSQKVGVQAPVWKQRVQKWAGVGLGYLVVASAAAGFTFAIMRPAPEPDVKTADAAALQKVRSLPADFDLQGDSSKLPALLRELSNTTNVQISARIPDEVLRTYSLGQGRLITWHGSPAVAVNLDPRPEFLNHNGPQRSATLVIVGAPRPPAQQVLEPDFGNRAGLVNEPGVQSPLRSWQSGQSRFLLVNDPME